MRFVTLVTLSVTDKKTTNIRQTLLKFIVEAPWVPSYPPKLYISGDLTKKAILKVGGFLFLCYPDTISAEST